MQNLKRNCILIIIWIHLLIFVQSIEIPVSEFESLFSNAFPSNVNDYDRTLWNQSESGIPSLKTQIDVQSVLAEGIGWTGSLGEETSNHIVITVTGVHPVTQTILPYSNGIIHIKIDDPDLIIPCALENGSGKDDFDSCDLSQTPRSFTTNALGRVSFSLPTQILDSYKGKGALFPALLIQTSFMNADEW